MYTIRLGAVTRVSAGNDREPYEITIMKKIAYTKILAVIAVMLFSAVGVLAAKLKTGIRGPLRRDTSNHSVQHTDKIPLLSG
jgi:hypothetical protein